MDGLTTIEALALSKAVEAWAKDVGLGEQDRALPAGTYPVNTRMVVEIEGAIRRQENYEAKPTARIPFLTVIALLMEKAGVTGRASIEMIRKAMEKALAMGENIEKGLEAQMKNVEAAKLEIEKMMEGLPKIPCKGALRATLRTQVKKVAGVGSAKGAA